MSVTPQAAPRQPKRPLNAGFATTSADIRASQALRYRAFAGQRAADPDGAAIPILVHVHEVDAWYARHLLDRVTQG